VDPDSAQADELRQLLNVVSGRAPDSQGRTSEPLVKEELAIVEFLTAKTNYKQASNTERPTRGDDQTPVDLLLGLAKTRSGRRAAEEEKRQIRLQQYREAEEQRAAQKRNGGMSSPWGYVAPSMPGLDVQQPFGQGNRGRAPRPLQPPQTKKSQDSPWSADIFDNLNNEIVPPPFASPRRSDQSPLRTSFTQPQRQQPQQPPFQAQQQQQQQQAQSFQQQQQQQQPQQNNGSFNLSPFASMSNLPLASPSQNVADMFAGNAAAQQFGQAISDGFDFADLGLNLESGAPNPTSIDWQNFNPFALQQTAQPGTEG
jgi:hypothetical protein